MNHRGIPDGDFVADSRCVRFPHDVNDGAVLDVRAAADANPVHVAANDDAHPDAALVANLNVANDLRAVVDIGSRMDAGQPPAVGPKHSRQL